jgi:hypothetical protein
VKVVSVRVVRVRVASVVMVGTVMAAGVMSEAAVMGRAVCVSAMTPAMASVGGMSTTMSPVSATMSAASFGEGRRSREEPERHDGRSHHE